MIMNAFVFALGMIAFTTFCSEKQNQESFEFNGWRLHSLYFGNLEKVECNKKEVDSAYTIIGASFNSLAYKKRKITPRAVVFNQELNKRIENDEK